MSRRIQITTVDNPFDPFQDFDSWLMFDMEKGYYTCERLARLANTTNEMSQQEEDEELERAIDRLIELDPLDIYKKIVKEDKDSNTKTDSNSKKEKESA